MEMCTFAVDDAYPEGICRGYRSNFLKVEDYENIVASASTNHVFKDFVDVSAPEFSDFLNAIGPNGDRLQGLFQPVRL